jgi:hypothetical protein
MVTRIRPVAQPRLPSAPLDYVPQFHEQYSNVLRLFFEQLINRYQHLSGEMAGST